MNPQLQFAIAEVPELIAWFKQRHAEAHPGADPLTDDQVKAMLAQALVSSILFDDNWLAVHPA